MVDIPGMGVGKWGIIGPIPSKMFALSSIVTPRRIQTASGLALSFSRGCFILGVSMVAGLFGNDDEGEKWWWWCWR